LDPALQPEFEFKLATKVNMLETAAMDSPATYLHWGFIYISWPNLLVILGMIVLFAIALIAPFPHGGAGDDVRNK
jgi:hypothetical protein